MILGVWSRDLTEVDGKTWNLEWLGRLVEV